MKKLVGLLTVIIGLANIGNSQTFAYIGGEAKPRLDVYSIEGAQDLPRFMLTHSAQGNAAARAEGVREFAELLQGAGAKVRVVDGRAYNHMQISRAVGVEADISGAITEFLRAD